ncbi:unnamed protein product [Eruca vesicaria subsp. sativa]|uniref:Uncharacterized protein n=1 Tax=Eruca vesicaria subsp. sativa TaxID=29727 RepID=A0ABC8KU30_ERUVS|nr:unnamed protein product [Eruca vesicaria subsp. sativa]
MDSQKIQTEKEPKAAVSTTTSCRKYVNDDNATFLANLKDHFNEFIKASMDEHKTCFKNTIDKIFGSSKEVETKEV